VISTSNPTPSISLAENFTGTQVNTQVFSLIQLSVIYLICWLTVYMEPAEQVRYIVAAGIFIFQFTSFYNAVAVLTLVLFIPFPDNLIGSEISGLKFQRIACWPAIYFSLRSKSIRKFPVQYGTVLLLTISFIFIKISADILHIVQEPPLSLGQTEALGLKNFIAKTFNIGLHLYVIYVVFTKFSQSNILRFFNLFVLLAALQAGTLIYLAIENPAVLVMEQGTFNNLLWQNPYFGHKNDWGILLVFALFLAINRFSTRNALKYFYILSIVLLLGGIAISLSRQAYVFTVLGFAITIGLKRDLKMTAGIFIIMLVLVIIQPEFLFTRMESMVNVESAEDFQNLNRKVSDLSINQFVKNLQIIPRMFYVEWEYNWSEGFWNGITHQLGILGLGYHIFIYLYFLVRFFGFMNQKPRNLSFLGLTCLIIVLLMFIGCANRRAINFMHYDGTIRQTGFIAIFLIAYCEYVYYSFHKKIVGSDRL